MKNSGNASIYGGNFRLEPITARSVVNSEYREARRKGIDCIIFVEQQVLDLLPHFKKNPGGDFSATVDYPDVFRFIDEISESTPWIFTFSRTDDILGTLRTQLSIRFRELLTRARSDRLTVPLSYVGESSVITTIAVDKDGQWEWRLACELLKDRMRRLEIKFSDLNSGFLVRRTRFLTARDALNYIGDLLNDLTNILQASAKILDEQLVPAFGTPGVPGDATEIKRACDNLYALFLSLYEWEMDVRFVRPHKVFERIFEGMHGWSDELLSEFHRLPREIDDLLSQPELSGHHSIRLDIKAPQGVEEIMAEFRKMAEDSSVFAALASNG